MNKRRHNLAGLSLKNDKWLSNQWDPVLTLARLDLGINERPIGGLGVIMVKKLMDEVLADYDGAGNSIVLRKRLHHLASE